MLNIHKVREIFDMAKNQTFYTLEFKWKLETNILKRVELGSKALSLKKKRFVIETNLQKHLEQIINL